jgi:hypothetical protein
MSDQDAQQVLSGLAYAPPLTSLGNITHGSILGRL